MTLLLVFAIVLLVAVLLSDLAVVYGLLVAESGIPAADTLFHLIALVVVASILAHNSTDVAVARWFVHAEKQAGEEAVQP